MKCNKINPILCMQPYNIYEILRCKCRQIPLIVNNTVIYRNRSYHRCALRCKLAAERLRISMRG